MRSLVVLLALLLLSCRPITAEVTTRPTLPPEISDSDTVTTISAMKITINDQTFTASLAQNAAAQAFGKMLPIVLTMSDLNDNEKYAYLSGGLPTAAQSVFSIKRGDLMLFGSSTLVLFYESFTTNYSYTPVAHLDDPSTLRAAVGSGDVVVKFEKR